MLEAFVDVPPGSVADGDGDGGGGDGGGGRCGRGGGGCGTAVAATAATADSPAVAGAAEEQADLGSALESIATALGSYLEKQRAAYALF